MYFWLDTESFLMSPGCQAPPLVCLQFAVDDQAVQIVHCKDPAAKQILEWGLTYCTTVGHFIAHDMACLCSTFGLDDLVFQAYDQGRVICTSIRQKLIDIALGNYLGDKKSEENKNPYSLENCLIRNSISHPVDKSNPWRLRYGLLYDVPVNQWPKEALEYALTDTHVTRLLYQAQEKHADLIHPGLILNYVHNIWPNPKSDPGTEQFRQSVSSFQHQLMTCWGLRTDYLSIFDVRTTALAQFQTDRSLLYENGLVRENGTRNEKEAQLRMTLVMQRLGEPVAMTPSNEVQLDEDACLASQDDVLIAFNRYGSLQSTLGKIDRLQKGIETPLQTRYNSLVATGRTSASMGKVKEGDAPVQWGYQTHNIPNSFEGIRECFVPRDGYEFSDVDWSGIELRCWAQVCIWLFGHSRLAEVLNNGDDPHIELGARIKGISKAEAYDIMKGKHGKDVQRYFKDHERQTAKVGNFGYQSGMGAEKLRVQARKVYRVFLTLEQCKALKQAWLAEWPEAQKYLRWIGSLTRGGHATIQQFVSGRVRGGCSYTEAANSFFQGLASELYKDAGWHLAKECYVIRTSPLYGSRIVAGVHDQWLLEVPKANAAAASQRHAEVMIEAGKRWLPDVRVEAKPILARYWSKNAEQVFDSRGNLSPWPEELAAA